MAVVKPSLGKEAITRWEIIERFERFSYVRCHPTTGRTHQIRVHLTSIGHPCIADTAYGKREAFFKKDVRGEDNDLLILRQALHARRLTFEHPISGEPMVLEAPLAEDMQQTLDFLREDTNPPSTPE